MTVPILCLVSLCLLLWVVLLKLEIARLKEQRPMPKAPKTGERRGSGSAAPGMRSFEIG